MLVMTRGYCINVKGNTWTGWETSVDGVQICQDVPWLKSITKMKARCVTSSESHGLSMQKRMITFVHRHMAFWIMLVHLRS